MKVEFTNYIQLTQTEHKKLLTIRNFAYIRKQMKNSALIDFQEHLQWVENLKTNKNVMHYAIQIDKTIVGALNVTNKRCNFSTSEWGVFFKNPVASLIKSTATIFFLQHLFDTLHTQIIYADVKKNNKNALTFNKNLGFKEIEIKNDIVVLSLNNENFRNKQESFLLKNIMKKMKSFEFHIEG